MKSCGTRGACRCHLSFNHRQIASNLSACSYRGHQPVLCSAWCVEVQESSVRHYQIHQQGFLPPHDAMPWFREPQVILSRLVGLSTTLSALWFCRKVGCWAKSLGRLGALILCFVRRGRLSRRPPDYGHLLMIPLYPGVRVLS